ncbi:nudC domain-containing protein 2 [Galendromus occidentalis]|uniref:NudC domain-containing protein 2 n=1 Tax=Galendromus occidentalis TaxID=34638 RepID=A0AAJ6QU72_9ACAR|nr:nudC domain-containing protein 2 [Galendromus occidentalis]
MASGCLSHFEERSGRIESSTSWGSWYQTVAEVFAIVNVPAGTRAKQLDIKITPRELHVALDGVKVFGGKLYRPVRADECTWTLEEKTKVLILLAKAEYSRPANEVWPSLLEGEFRADPLVLHEMRKKIDLEKFQLENPGFDFSGAELSKKYDSAPDVEETL